MQVDEAIRARRTVKEYREEPVPRELLAQLLELVVEAPNHRLTEPWRFVALGPEARRRLGEILGEDKAARVDGPEVKEMVTRKSVKRLVATPGTVAFIQQLDPDPAIREEDYAAIWMGIQNLLLGAAARGLMSQVKTGSVLETGPLRRFLGAEERERVVGLVYLGAPAGDPPRRARGPAAERTRWLP